MVNFRALSLFTLLFGTAALALPAHQRRSANVPGDRNLNLATRGNTAVQGHTHISLDRRNAASSSSSLVKRMDPTPVQVMTNALETAERANKQAHDAYSAAAWAHAAAANHYRQAKNAAKVQEHTLKSGQAQREEGRYDTEEHRLRTIRLNLSNNAALNQRLIDDAATSTRNARAATRAANTSAQEAHV